MGSRAGEGPEAAVTDPRTAAVDLPSENGMAAAARASVRAFLESVPGAGLEERDLDEICVVVQEACTNAIRHAHGHDATKRFRVDVSLRDGGVEILVRDQGAPFDLDTSERPLRPELLQEGGYGIHIMRTWMDAVAVTHDGTGNVLRLWRRCDRARRGEGDLVAR